MYGFFLRLEIRSLTLMAYHVCHLCDAVAWDACGSWLSTGEHLQMFVCGKGHQGPCSASGGYEPMENTLTLLHLETLEVQSDHSSEGPGGTGHQLSNLIIHLHLAFHHSLFTVLSFSALKGYFPKSVICI